ncbi:uncharacterized protein HD556DRAFT_263648 [Suillus plorans]|uniref:Uncharacterized protein n=1 Tax=Suillus plorans TaxID=116603 RepID=A0A9P7DKC7_9AGAM|nr:uncharacterized protein HD556DRAFT_263648 [Suillus plorans]KAG1796972.1 hypothetical protein HD556DRAFT_263648 [Suillus plorans]
MMNTTLIRKLLKRLFQVLATLATSSARRLLILVSCFRHFVAKVHVSISHDTNSKFSTVDSRRTGTSSAQCSQSTLPLPLHTTPSSAASSVASTPPYTMPVPSVPQLANSPQTWTSLPPAVDHKSRYENRPFVDTSDSIGIPAFMRSFPNQSCPWLSGEWQPCIHPEGALYLYNGRKRTFTEGHINEYLFRLMDKCADALYDLARTKSPNFDAGDIELVVQVVPNQTDSCQYYFVDHETRTLFWLHVYDQATETVFDGLQGVCDPSHIRTLCELMALVI